MPPVKMPYSAEQLRARAARKRAKDRKVQRERLAALPRVETFKAKTKAAAQDASDARVLEKYNRDNDIVSHADESLVTDAECRHAKRLYPENSAARVVWLQGQSARRNIARHEAERRAKRKEDGFIAPTVSAIVTTATMNALLFAIVLSLLYTVLPDPQLHLAMLFAALLFAARICIAAVTRMPA